MRLPRKLKKKAKKLKAAHDAMVMTQGAVVSMQGAMQLAMVIASPIYYPHEIALKAIKGAEVAMDTAQAVSKCMAQMKHYREFVKVN